MDTVLLELLALQHNPWRAAVCLRNQTVVTGIIPYDTIEFDPCGSLTMGTNFQYTCPVDGYYHAFLQARVTAALHWVPQIYVVQSGVTASSAGGYYGASQMSIGQAEDTWKCKAGDYFYTGAGACTLVGAAADNFFYVEWTGPA